MQESSLLSEGRRMQGGEGESLLSSSSCTTTCVNTDSHGRPFFTAASNACEGAKSFREVRPEPVYVVSPPGGKKRADERQAEL